MRENRPFIVGSKKGMFFYMYLWGSCTYLAKIAAIYIAAANSPAASSTRPARLAPAPPVRSAPDPAAAVMAVNASAPDPVMPAGFCRTRLTLLIAPKAIGLDAARWVAIVTVSPALWTVAVVSPDFFAKLLSVGGSGLGELTGGRSVPSARLPGAGIRVLRDTCEYDLCA